MSVCNKVYTAISAVQGELAKLGIAKSRDATVAGGGSYKFRGIDDVYNVLAKILSEHGLVIVPRIVERTQVERTAGSGKALFYTVVTAEFDFHADDGSICTARTFGEAMDSGDKGTNKAMSAAYKYMAFMTFAIPVEGEPDADEDTHVVESTEIEWVKKIVAVPDEDKLDDLKQAIIDDYKGISNVPNVLRKAMNGKRAALRGGGEADLNAVHGTGYPSE